MGGGLPKTAGFLSGAEVASVGSSSLSRAPSGCAPSAQFVALVLAGELFIGWLRGARRLLEARRGGDRGESGRPHHHQRPSTGAWHQMEELATKGARMGSVWMGN